MRNSDVVYFEKESEGWEFGLMTSNLRHDRLEDSATPPDDDASDGTAGQKRSQGVERGTIYSLRSSGSAICWDEIRAVVLPCADPLAGLHVRNFLRRSRRTGRRYLPFNRAPNAPGS